MENSKDDKKQFTAADIEKYHKGLLSAKEMHALEKAALDDPFLADALEGYAVSDVNANADITELKNRLTKRTEEESKVIPIATDKTSSFSWWKAAAMIVLIAGAGLIVYQLGFNKKSTDIAQIASPKSGKAEAKDSGKTIPPALLNTDINTKSTTATEQEKDEVKTEDVKSSSANATKEQNQERIAKPKAVINDADVPANAPTVSSAPVNVAAQKNKEEILNEGIRQKKISAAKQEEFKVRRQDKELDGIVVTGEAGQKRNVAVSNQPVEIYKAKENRAFNQSNIFRGRVTDAYNNALPFSNITNTEDSIGTYSDARGYFTLTSPDSILNVQVRSLGFENNNVQLQNNVPNNQVQLQEDRSSLAEVVISNKKPNSNRARSSTMVLEEPEPADGWSNYDIYLANNLKVPENLKGKQTGIMGEVELSFEVDKNGEPVNITVKKSLCEACDKEAIRLLKEGPKWKKKGKQVKAKVTVGF